jgi:hypothetical protein
MGAVVCPANTIIDTSIDDHWSRLTKGKVIPLSAVPLDEQALQEQLREYPEARHLLSGGWEEK